MEERSSLEYLFKDIFKNIYRLSLFLGLMLLSLGVTSCKKGSIKSYQPKNDPYREVSSEKDPLHLVLDIDWTLVIPLTEEQAKHFSGDKRLLIVGEETYLLKEGARELLEVAFNHPQIKVSFFSGGGKHRNRTLLKSLLFRDGSNALEKSYKVLSKEDLTVVSTDQRLRFSERFKKDMRKVHPDLDRVLLIEDLAHFALGEGQENTLWLGKTFYPKIPQMAWEESLQTWQELGVEARYLPPHQEADWWARRKLFILQALLDWSQNPNKILDKAEELNYSRELAPKAVDRWLERAPLYQRFIDQGPCTIPQFF